MIHGIPGHKFLSEHIHPAQERQLEEKFEEIQIPEDQRVGLSHPFAKALEMDGHLRPMKTRTVVVAEVVSFIHKVDFIDDGNRICEIIIGLLWVTEGVLNPSGDGIDKVHAENGNHYEAHPNSPVVNKDSDAVTVEARHSL